MMPHIPIRTRVRTQVRTCGYINQTKFHLTKHSHILENVRMSVSDSLDGAAD